MRDVLFLCPRNSSPSPASEQLCENRIDETNGTAHPQMRRLYTVSEVSEQFEISQQWLYEVRASSSALTANKGFRTTASAAHRDLNWMRSKLS